MSVDERNNVWGIVLAGGEGTRVQSFLSQLCAGKGIKQFCTIIGQRSMVQQTVHRVEQLICRDHILVSLNSRHRREAIEQLRDLPQKNLIFQPANLDTGPGILLPLAHISHRDPEAIVAVFPSDHFIRDDRSFLTCAERGVAEVRNQADTLVLLGVSPKGPDEGYGWIEPAVVRQDQEPVAVRNFWEKPDAKEARKLMLRGALWNTFVFVARAKTLWNMVAHFDPELYCIFSTISLTLPNDHARNVIDYAYKALRPVNFSSTIMSKSNAHLRVIRMPDVGWSDWGTRERILASLKEIGRLDECLERLKSPQVETIRAS